jgi:DNA-binding MarR family transcriptional regulator
MALSRAVVAMTSRSLSEAGADVTMTQYRTLIVLASRGPQRVADLAKELAVLPSTVTRLCDRLVARGLVARHPGATDRRAVWIGLTATGQELVGQVVTTRRELLSELVADVSIEDPASFARSAERIALTAGEVPERKWWEQWGRAMQPHHDRTPSASGGRP